MKLKLLPVSFAVACALSSLTVHSEGFSETTNTNVLEGATDHQPIILSPEVIVPEGVVFTGYARYGARYNDSDTDYVTAEGQLAGNAAGRLGNEGNGGEFQFAKAFVGNNGAIWDVVLMMENWGGSSDTGGGDVNLKKFYAGGTNIFESQPNAYIWAGRDFHQRPQQSLNDYFWMTHDGQGAGIYNLELSSVKLDFAVVGQTDGLDDSENYAFTSKLHGIDLSNDLALSFLFNYGFTSVDDNELATDEASNAYQIAAVLNHTWKMGQNKFIARYADSADNSVYNKTEDLTTLYLSLDGEIKFNDNWSLEYLGGYHNYTNDATDTYNRSNYSAIIRPMFNWNETHSTWLEAGYSLVDFDNQDEQNSAWKMTLSQNIAINAFENARPMLRFYATVGQSDNEVYLDGSDSTTEDALALGAMFEAWW